MLTHARHCLGGPAYTEPSDVPGTDSSAPVEILAVDDNDENLEILEAFLSEEGVTLLLARSGEEALDLLETHDVALALLDVQMPEMDGYELAARMRESRRLRCIPILFTTAGAVDRSEEFRADDAGAVEFLTKPLDGDRLRQKTDEYVRQYRRQLTRQEHVQQNDNEKDETSDEPPPQSSRRVVFLPW